MSAEGSPVRWVVSAGDYSDYKVMCVCDSKQRAETVAALYNSDDDVWSKARVEPITYVASTPEKVTIHSLTVTVWDDGTASDQRQHARTEWPFDALYGPHRPVEWRWVRAPMHKDKGGRLDVWGTDLGRVRRTLSDKRAQLLADPAMRQRPEWKSR